MRGVALLLGILFVAAAGTEWALQRQRRAGWKRLEVTMRAEMEHGSLQSLLRARLAGVRATLADDRNPTVNGHLAFIDALLTHIYGLPLEAEAHAALDRASTSWGPESEAARALIALRRGDRAAAERIASAATHRAPAAVEPLLALAEVRSAAGDLTGAARSLNAAVIVAPTQIEPRVAWAELRLELGDPGAVRDTLRPLLATVPDHTRGWLLLAEAELALGGPQDGPALEEGCRRDGAVSSTVAAGCAMLAAERERMAMRPAAMHTALAHATQLAPQVRSARLLARTAQLQAQLGRVDEADRLARQAATLASSELPNLAWAQVALALGRGHSPERPPALPVLGPESAVLSARTAFAIGGAGALADALAELSPALRAHPDLAVLAPLGLPSSQVPADSGPLGSYVAGVLARLAGDLPTAAGHLARALDGHGDACRAAGEYVATLHELHRLPEAGLLDPLRAVNADCVNLPGAGAPEVEPGRRRRPVSRALRGG